MNFSNNALHDFNEKCLKCLKTNKLGHTDYGKSTLAYNETNTGVFSEFFFVV